MAFFKFRKGTDESPRAPAQPQSIEAIRQRAKYRLAGATLLVLIGVVGLPMLFDKQPRPIAVDTPISIPDKNKVPALVIPATPAVAPPVATATAPEVAAEAVAKPATPVSPEKTNETAAASADNNNASKPPLALTDKAQAATNIIEKEAPAVSKPEPTKPETNRAQALLDGKDTNAKAAEAQVPDTKPVAAKQPVTETRFVVQVGAFAENARAHEVRMKLERAGLKTYAQTAQTKDGQRIRVRLGPFATRAEAEKAAEKVKKLSLPAAVLTL
ncbi:SPOR domain-containing protein [Rhodoferax antarcticus]|uniref:SPOR domain-containing protein n=1 Tax=Rhodoferax antarcticus TaxID=81479 RepID=UPI00222579E7|nr:SPOR domain-containing protein [Rhodoferax antarcticus]MCW2311616.1 DedD protein [Rhodoferax antarcticus]